MTLSDRTVYRLQKLFSEEPSSGNNTKIAGSQCSLGNYEIYSDFLENSEMKENADCDILNAYFESRNCTVSSNGTSNQCP